MPEGTGICSVCHRSVKFTNSFGSFNELDHHFVENSYDICPGSYHSPLDPNPRGTAGNIRFLAFFVVAGILAWTSIVWVPLLAGIIYRAFQ
jgi:hypothetical protein